MDERKDASIVRQLPIRLSLLHLTAQRRARRRRMAGKRKAVDDLLSIASASATAPPPKKARAGGAKQAAAPLVEKRGARVRKSCPMNILERVARVMSQRSVASPFTASLRPKYCPQLLYGGQKANRPRASGGIQRPRLYRKRA